LPPDGGSGLDPSCTGVPAAAEGFALDFGDWTPPLDQDSLGQWSGTCAIGDVQPTATTLVCADDPLGPATIEIALPHATIAPAWAVDDVVAVSYQFVGFGGIEGEYLSLRANDDQRLLLSLGHGGGDGNLPWLDADPLTYEVDLEVCGPAGEGEQFPGQVTFVEPGGTAFDLMQGDEATLTGDVGEQYSVVLYQAEYGDFDNDDWGSFYDVVIQRLAE
jgi:hypothetical protein